jgi:hypothetical protein
MVPQRSIRTLFDDSATQLSCAVSETLHLHGLAAMFTWDALGYLASGLVVAAFCMKDIIPLRAVAVGSNLAFLTYGFALGLVPVWLLHAILLPINCWRLWQGVFSNLPEPSVRTTTRLLRLF